MKNKLNFALYVISITTFLIAILADSTNNDPTIFIGMSIFAKVWAMD